MISDVLLAYVRYRHTSCVGGREGRQRGVRRPSRCLTDLADPDRLMVNQQVKRYLANSWVA
jgi:hypothetical protein